VSASPQGRIRILDSVAAAEVPWRALEARAVTTAFQSYRWHEAWSRIVGPARREQPVIVVVEDDEGKATALLPFALTMSQGASVLGWQGQDHAGYAMGLFAPGVAESLDKRRLTALIDAICRRHPCVSALRLKNQPMVWRGVANPLAELGVQEGASRSYQLALAPDFAAQMNRSLSSSARGSLGRKARALALVPGFSLDSADTTERRLALLDSFFAQKARQFAERGIPNPFDAPEIVAFYRDLAGAEGAATPLLECHALTTQACILATAATITFQDQRHLLTLSLGADIPDLRKHSPGLVLIRHLMSEAAADGIALYDFGAGDGQHKSMWRPDTVRLFETHRPLNLRGYAVSLAAASQSHVKRLIKNNAFLWHVATSARRRIRGGRV
jgi:CelD/BcsL family acetyltransferase involved in cellulose biosynthesis